MKNLKLNIQHSTPNTQHQHAVHPPNPHFTLIELLVVLGIVIIIFSISLPAFLTMTKGQSVEIAARTIGSKLNAVRAYAITHREYTALVFITDESVSNNRYNYRAYRPCIVSSSGVFESWVQDEKWEYFPTSTALLSLSNSSTITSVEDDKVFGNGITKDLIGVIFKSTGDCLGSRKTVVVGEGVYINNALKQLNADNTIDITVDMYTGRVSYGSD
jgi:type II secretory pathway pseudopilin PulG